MILASSLFQQTLEPWLCAGGPTQWLGRCQDLQNTSCPQGSASHFPWKMNIKGYSQVSHQVIVRTKHGSAQHPGDSKQRVFNTSGNAMRKIRPFPPFLSIDCLISTSVVKITFLLVFGGDFYFNKRKWGKRDAQSARQIMACKQEDLIRSVSSTDTSVLSIAVHICNPSTRGVKQAYSWSCLACQPS